MASQLITPALVVPNQDPGTLKVYRPQDWQQASLP